MGEMGDANSDGTVSDPTRPTAWSFTHAWTTFDVGCFIEDIGYPKYAKCFTNNMINGRGLKHLTVFDLQRIGVSNMADAMRMHAIIKRAATRDVYNFEHPETPPNPIYYRNTVDDSQNFKIKLRPANPFYLAPIKPGELTLPSKDVEGRYKRYHIPLPNINHQRSVCTRKTDDSMARATSHH